MKKKQVNNLSETESENEKGRKRGREESDTSASEPEIEKDLEDVLLQISSHEQNFEEIEKLEVLTEKVKGDKKFLKTVTLPGIPLTWSAAKDIYSRRISLVHGRKKVICSVCHMIKARGASAHVCLRKEHSFKDCVEQHLKGNK